MESFVELGVNSIYGYYHIPTLMSLCFFLSFFLISKHDSTMSTAKCWSSLRKAGKGSPEIGRKVFFVSQSEKKKLFFNHYYP